MKFLCQLLQKLYLKQTDRHTDRYTHTHKHTHRHDKVNLRGNLPLSFVFIGGALEGGDVVEAHGDVIL